jgi:uncharacterized protein (TIGR00369 family)
MDAPLYTRTALTPEQAAVHDRVLGDLAQATRELADAQLRTEVDLEEAAAVTAEVRRLTERLRARATDGALGIELGPGRKEIRNHGNAVVGLRNPFAAVRKADRHIDSDRRVRYDVELGALHEGPPGLVHGGVSALLLDQVLGEAAAVGGAPGMTARLTVHYRRPTPLGKLTVHCRLERTDGRKTVVRGEIRDPEDRVTVEAEGLFVLPRWAAEHPEWEGREQSFE